MKYSYNFKSTVSFDYDQLIGYLWSLIGQHYESLQPISHWVSYINYKGSHFVGTQT